VKVPAERVHRLRTAKGRRPWFFKNPEMDQFVAMLMAVATEVSVLRERIDTIERVAAARGLFSGDDIEKYRPPEEVQAWRDEWRARYLDRIFRILEEELDDIRYREADAEYERIISGVAVE
jgi:hypothetical protein